MPMIKSKGCASDGAETVWVESGPLAGFAKLVVWKSTKDVPARSKYKIPFTWAVQGPSGDYKARGWGRTYKQALTKAEKARAYILENSVRSFTAPDYLSDKWENMVAD